MDHTAFALFQSAVALPNLITPLFGGLWLDYSNNSRNKQSPVNSVAHATLFSLICTVIGHSLFALSVRHHCYSYALCSRVLFGLGQGCTVVAQGRIIANVFATNNELVFAVALTEATHNIANFIGAVYPVYVTTLAHNDYVAALWFGVFICMLSLLAGVLLFMTTDTSVQSEGSAAASAAAEAHGHAHEQHQHAQQPLSLCASCDNDSHQQTHSVPHTTTAAIYRTVHNLRHISAPFLLLCLLHCLFSNVHHLFGYVLANMMATDWNYSVNGAALLSGVTSGVAIFLCPVMGLLLDRSGNKMWACCAAGVASAAAYIMLAFFKDTVHVVIPLVMLAVCMSFVPTVLRSAVPSLVPTALFGSAYGLYSVSESVGAVVGHSFTGYVRDANRSYQQNLLIFAFLAVLAATLALVLCLYDAATGGSLNKTHRQQQHADIDHSNSQGHYESISTATDEDKTESTAIAAATITVDACVCGCHA